MPIDWFTVVAQAINFLLLVWLLKRFLYGPITRAMAAREERIASRLEEAERERDEAAEHNRELQSERKTLQNERDEMIEQARREADQTRRDMLDQARQAVEQTEARWRDQLRRRREEVADDLTAQAAEHVAAATRRALADLADDDLLTRMAGVLGGRLESMDEPQREAWREAIGEGPVAVRSAPALTGETRGRIEEAVRRLCRPDTPVEVEEDESLVCGLELRAGGRRIGWSVGGYVDELRSALLESLRRASQRGRGPEDGEGEAGAERAEERARA